jgi:hypothetical protein
MPPSLNLLALQKLPKTDKATVSKQEVGPTIPRTDKTPSNATSPSQHPPVPQPTTPNPSTPTSNQSSLSPGISPYEDLSKINDHLVILDRQWRRDILTVNQDFTRKSKDSGEHTPPKLPDQLAQNLIDDEDAETEDYNETRPQILRVHDAAIDYMHFTPNQRADDAGKFKQADEQALKKTAIVNLEKDQAKENQFEGMKEYIAGLLHQLGDYH